MPSFSGSEVIFGFYFSRNVQSGLWIILDREIFNHLWFWTSLLENMNTETIFAVFSFIFCQLGSIAYIFEPIGSILSALITGKNVKLKWPCLRMTYNLICFSFFSSFFFFAFIFSAWIDVLGRKGAMMIVNLPLVIAWFLMYNATTLWEIFISTILLGVINLNKFQSKLFFFSLTLLYLPARGWSHGEPYNHVRKYYFLYIFYIFLIYFLPIYFINILLHVFWCEFLLLLL